MKDINLKLDLNADPKTIGLLGVAVFVASRAGARISSKREGGLHTRYNRYDRLSPRRHSGSIRATIADGIATTISRGFWGDPAPRPINPEYGQYVRTQRALDRINNRLDAMLEIMPDKTETVRMRVSDPGHALKAAVETKDGNPVSVLMDSVDEVKELINAMSERAETYEAATVSDLYDLLGVSSKFVDGKWGWTHTNDFTYEVLEDEGVRLALPPAEKL